MLYIYIKCFNSFFKKKTIMQTFSNKTTRFLKIHRLCRSNKEVPIIRLEGKWITEIGFEIGESVSISIREKLLIIMPIE